MEKLLVWGGQVEKVPCTEHAFAWSGKIPCTGVYRCVLCGITKEEVEKVSKKKRKTPPIVIKTVKVRRGRILWREIIFVSALTVEDLPREYLDDVPNVLMSYPSVNTRQLDVQDDAVPLYLMEGQMYGESAF